MTPTDEHPTILPMPCPTDLGDAWRDWQPMEAMLSWLECLRTLMHDTGGMTAEDQLLMNPMARALLMAAAGTLDRAIPVPASPEAALVPTSVAPVRTEADLIPWRKPLAAHTVIPSCMTASVWCAT